ncbi:DNA mismatch endonuclease Vsr [Rhodococcus hoagii]|nr:DNA mismatch endonuclease Vsr [Prescottella equi]NKR71621.1 DNA mismatch endonuclease Vsr [Prescottella equi]
MRPRSTAFAREGQLVSHRVHSPKARDPRRSRNMRANRRVDTKPEVALRSELHRLGYRFRKDVRIDLDDIRVRPDIVFTRRMVAVFVDGCFWHVCPIHGRYPTANEWYWTPKLHRNIERDRVADQALTNAGWTVVRVWEHEPLTESVRRVESKLRACPGDVS